MHEDSGVADGMSGCPCGIWIPGSRSGAGKRGGVEDHRGAEGYKYAYHFFPAVVKLGFDPLWFGMLIAITVMIGMVIPAPGSHRESSPCA